MIYLCAGLYAEGPTDYRFLLPLTTRLILELAHAEFPAACEVADSVGIDARRKTRSREARIPEAIDEHWSECTLFIVHSDGNGNPEIVLEQSITPGLEAARASHPDLVCVACIPVREIEAWLLADPSVFQKLFRRAPDLPLDPEADADPKATFRRLIAEMGGGREADYYAFFGENVDFARLRRLTAFGQFERDLIDAIRILGP